MRANTMVGIVLIVIGVVILVYQGITSHVQGVRLNHTIFAREARPARPEDGAAR
jgi:hypothetical protein